MRHLLATATFCIALAAVLSPAAAQTAADGPSATVAGTPFVLPGGWTRTQAGNATILAPPEAGGSRVAIVDAVAGDPDAAIAEAWRTLGVSPKLLVASDGAPRDGWEQRRFYTYDVAENAHRVVRAVALRSGKKWTAMVVDVDQGIAEKRSSQLGKINQRLMPAGYKRETFAGRTARRRVLRAGGCRRQAQAGGARWAA